MQQFSQFSLLAISLYNHHTAVTTAPQTVVAVVYNTTTDRLALVGPCCNNKGMLSLALRCHLGGLSLHCFSSRKQTANCKGNLFGCQWSH